MEDALVKLNDNLSRKEIETYSVTGRTMDGTFRFYIKPAAKFKEEITHYVYLQSFNGWSYFSNLDSSNNQFIYFSESANASRIIEFESGSYQLVSYNSFIHSKMLEYGDHGNMKGEPVNNRSEDEIRADKDDEYPISLFPYPPTGRVMIRVKKGYKVYFNQGTWFRELGFNENQVLSEGLHMAPNRADIMKTLKVRIKCNICRGWKINSPKDPHQVTFSNTLYEFSNNLSPGEPISITPNPVIYTTLIQKQFNEIILTFEDDDNKPVTFDSEEWSCVICIVQG